MIIEVFFADMYVDKVAQIPAYDFWNFLGELLRQNQAHLPLRSLKRILDIDIYSLLYVISFSNGNS